MHVGSSSLAFPQIENDPHDHSHNEAHSQENAHHGTAVLAYGGPWLASRGAAMSRILASDWTKLAGVVIALATTLVMIGRWQGQTEGQLTAILARVTAIEAQGQGWHVLAQTSATHAYRLQAIEVEAERLEQRVRALETER